MDIQINTQQAKTKRVIAKDEKILLLLLPYWTPQLPPMGIACLKSYLKQQGYNNIVTVDANVEMELREGYDLYFAKLRSMIPKDKEGNFRSIGNDVWQNHMMAHINKDKAEGDTYDRLAEKLVWEIFFHKVSPEDLAELNGIIQLTYDRLESYLMKLYEKEKPSVVGVSAFIGTLASSVYACKVARRNNPDVLNVIGGGAFCDQLGILSPNLEYFSQQTKDIIDYILIGEGEILFHKLLEGKLPEGKRIYGIKDIQGQVVDLATVERPDISDFELHHYPSLGSYASRSCPFQCKFCSDPVLWGEFRKKEPKQIVRELTQTYRETGNQIFIMTDLLMNPNVTQLSQEFEKSDVSIYWDCPFRICEEACDEENTFLWRRGGYYRVEMGCESGSPRMLKLMDKRITVDQIRRALKALAKAGIKTTTYWVIGFPGETEEDFQMTLDLVEELKDYIYEAMNNAFWFYPGAPVNSSNWVGKSFPLFSEKDRELLLVQQWLLDLEPNREERYRRVNRFVAHRRKLGIPDINTLQHIYEADERWKRLHKNAVPPLVEFQRGQYIDENKYIKRQTAVRNTLKHDDNWGF